MDTPSRHSIYVLPPLRSPRERHLCILVLADGNQRAEASGGGYERGARNVIEIAEHLAARTDVARLIACILSPDNVTKRGSSFFAKVHAELVRLREAIETRNVLVGAGVRLGIAGDLRALSARGGDAAKLAEAIEAAVGATARVAAPRLELLFGVGYSPQVAIDLDVDVILRTGMEEERTLRLSGLSSHPGILNVATTKLWPEVTVQDMDRVIAAAKRRTDPVLAAGHPIEMVSDLFVELAKRPLAAPVSVTIPTAAAPRSIMEALDRVHDVSPPRFDLVEMHAHTASGELVSFDGWGEREASGSEARRFVSMIAPGQAATGLIVPVSPSLGHANVFASGPSAAEIADGIERALRFAIAHPPLHGADRPAGHVPMTQAMNDAWTAEIIGWVGLVEQRPGRRVVELVEAARRPGYFVFDDPNVIADMFSAKLLCWGRSSGLLLASEGSLRAALNYVLTAFFIHYDGLRARGAVEADWETAADLSARAMLVIAAGDDGIFDGVFEGETKEAWRHRLAESARFLQAMVSDELTEPPEVNGAPLLSAIARQWRVIFDEHRGVSHAEVLEGWRASVLGLYRASLDEYDDTRVDNALVGKLDTSEAAAAAFEIEERYAAVAPPAVGDRIRELVHEANDGAARAELRLLLYLHDTATSIAAGLLFRTIALRVPAREVRAEMARALDTTATLVDWAFRLDNDIASFVGWAEGERDAKRGACAVLVPRGLEGASEEAAVRQSLSVCRTVGAWLRKLLSAALGDLEALWPAMATAVRRGTFVGRRVYQIGHYEKLTRGQMTEIMDELDAREGTSALVAKAG